MILKNIKGRCNNPKNKSYKYYGGRGIKCKIIEDEIKKLWYKYKAYNMKQPSIDRKNHNKHYTYENCRFIEQSKNIGDRNKRISIKPILQFTKDGKFIKQYSSIKEASNILKIRSSSICAMLKGLSKTSGGFKWKYKK